MPGNNRRHLTSVPGERQASAGMRWTHGIALVVAAFIVLNACGPAPPVPPPTVIAGWSGPDVIEVRTLGPRPLEVAELIGPDGTTWPATAIRNDGRADAAKRRPGFGVFVEGGSSSGINPGVVIDLPMGSGSARPPGPFAGRAAIPLPDPARYRESWPDWRIRVRLGPPAADAPSALVPAPAPPDPP